MSDLKRLEQCTEIVAAYVSRNSTKAGDLAELITQIYSTLAALETAEPSAVPQEPAVPIAKSVRPKAITCLECGLEFQSLKRHIRNSHDLSPEKYRAKWGLLPTYPMVAPNYAARRSQLAKEIGLGTKATTPQRRGR